VLDLGCGAGVPITRALAERFDVTGVDISSEQLVLARTQVPEATFVHADMVECTFPRSSFDAVVSFYAIFHLPLAQQPSLLARIAEWLKPGGYLIATLARVHEEGYTEDDFFGAEMYWSNLSLREYLALLREAGFEILSRADAGHGYSDETSRPESHPLVFARKTRPAGPTPTTP
jgi:cyclopropane fatty-acyl-phospholipid synthase-like methyltransferase